jgi:hypothetical protein
LDLEIALKTILTLCAAAVMAIAMSGDAWAVEKRKLRAHLSPQVLAAAQNSSLDMALLKARAQLRIKRPTAGIRFQ